MPLVQAEGKSGKGRKPTKRHSETASSRNLIACSRQRLSPSRLRLRSGAKTRMAVVVRIQGHGKSRNPGIPKLDIKFTRQPRRMHSNLNKSNRCTKGKFPVASCTASEQCAHSNPLPGALSTQSPATQPLGCRSRSLSLTYASVCAKFLILDDAGYLDPKNSITDFSGSVSGR